MRQGREAITKICSVCLSRLSTDKFYASKGGKYGVTSRCKKCSAELSKKRYDDGARQTCNTPKEIRRIQQASARLKRQHGFDLNEYHNKLASQGGGCAICGKPPGKRRLHADHNHATKENRGLLCENCNRGIGCAKENVEVLRASIAYIGRWQFLDSLVVGDSVTNEFSPAD